MSTRPSSWPTATSELLPTTLFSIANQYPDLIYAEYFDDLQDLASGHRKVTYREFAIAVHGLAWWIEENVGKSSVRDGKKTIVYILGVGEHRCWIHGMSRLHGAMATQELFVSAFVQPQEYPSRELTPLLSRCSFLLPATAPNPSPASLTK
jgi:hypothetical protein